MANEPLKPSAIGASLPRTAGHPASGVPSGEPVTRDGSTSPGSHLPSKGELGEKVQISRAARDLLRQSELMADARQSLQSQSEIREDRVAEVRSRLEAGVYDTKAVKEEVAQRLASILGDLPYGGGSGRGA